MTFGHAVVFCASLFQFILIRVVYLSIVNTRNYDLLFISQSAHAGPIDTVDMQSLFKIIAICHFIDNYSALRDRCNRSGRFLNK